MVSTFPDFCYRKLVPKNLWSIRNPLNSKIQFISWDMCSCTCMSHHKCKISCTSEKLSKPTSLSTVQFCMPKWGFTVVTATLATVTFCFHNSTLSRFILNETFHMLQQLETPYLGCTNLGSHVPFQIIKSNRSCKQEHTCKLTLLHQFPPGMDWKSSYKYVNLNYRKWLTKAN